MGVRISTTPTKLREQVKPSVKEAGYKWRAGAVTYMSQAELNRNARQIKDELRTNFTIRRAADPLFMKRDAFRHESEWRAMVYCPDQSAAESKPGLAISVDPHSLIDRILLDPRAPEELVGAFKFYFEKKLKFKGEVVRSVLYKSPKPLRVDDEAL